MHTSLGSLQTVPGSFLTRKYPVGMSLPATGATSYHGRQYRRYWGRSEAERAGERQLEAYLAATGKDAPPAFTEGLAKAQWEYGIQGTAYWTKKARQGVLALTASA